MALFLKRFFLVVWIAVLAVVVVYVMNQKNSEPPAPTPPPTKDFLPVVYAVDDWQPAPRTPLSDIAGLVALAGAGAVMDTTLDFDGNPAEMYRLHHKASAPFWVGVSDKYVEIFWYYAPPKDDDLHKQLSQKYAQKAHAITTAVLGRDGHRLIKEILTGKSATAQGVKWANCQAYQCQVVLIRK